MDLKLDLIMDVALLSLFLFLIKDVNISTPEIARNKCNSHGKHHLGGPQAHKEIILLQSLIPKNKLRKQLHHLQSIMQQNNGTHSWLTP